MGGKLVKLAKIGGKLVICHKKNEAIRYRGRGCSSGGYCSGDAVVEDAKMAVEEDNILDGALDKTIEGDVAEEEVLQKEAM
jgi:hypothetical protein